MTVFQRIVMAMYGWALRLYPRAFRERYTGQMADAAAQSFAESDSTWRTAAGLGWDLCASVLREHQRAASFPVPVVVAILGVAFSAALLGVAVQNQRSFRRGADAGPHSVVVEMRRLAAQGSMPAGLVVGRPAEIGSEAWRNGSEVFSAVYDEAGLPIASSATLRGALPEPPKGIFEHVRRYGGHRVTWQPAGGIRVALTVEHLPQGGFVLAGQSLTPGETREQRFRLVLLWVWAATITASLAVLGGMAYLRSRRRA